MDDPAVGLSNGRMIAIDGVAGMEITEAKCYRFSMSTFLKAGLRSG